MGSVSPAVPVAVASLLLLLLLASLALPAIAVPARREEEVRNLYEGWLLRHQRGRAHNALGKKERRFEIFKDILRFIDEHNAAADAGERSSRLARRCNGELMDYAFEFIITNGGIDTEKGYPYKERDGRCDSLRKNANVVSINSYEDLPINDDKALQKAVANPPVSVSIEGGGRAFQLYESVNSSPCESPERINMLKSELASLLKNAELKKQIRDLSTKLQLAEQGKDHAQKQFLVLGEQHKAGPFGTVKASRTNPTVVPDESVNPRLAEILEKVAVRKELVVAVANSNVREMLEVWFNNIKRVGIPNYLVVALDDDIERFCKSKEVPVYRRNPDEAIDSIGKYGGNQAVSSLKFHILREFLLLGYSVLISDVDIVYLQNPFDHLYRDSDVESMSDGHNNMTAYGYDDVFDEPSMGWARYAHTMRIWAYDSGFFYIRPTIPSIELLDRVADRLSRQPNSWDQAVFNEELYFPSHPGYDGLHASKRTMDIHLFMNSMVLFKDVRKDAQLKKKKPVIVHVNYHPDKLSRMKAVVEFYVNGKQNALEPFPDGSDW